MAEMEGEGKLGAYRTRGGDAWDRRAGEPVLYLGAAQGVTASWMARRQDGPVVAVEKSPVAGLTLLRRAREHADLIPYVGDARDPGDYDPLVPELGLLYQDIAQRDQVNLFAENVRRFAPRRAFLAVKARSIAVERDPRGVVDDAADELASVGDVVDVVPLDPFHKDHAMIVLDPDG